MTHSRTRIHELLDQSGLAPRRDLGQNFVADANTVNRIAHLAGVGPGDHVIEIGAGLGSLTLALAATGATVVAVEVDRGVVPVLRDVVAGEPDVTVVQADAMSADWSELLAGSDRWTHSTPSCRRKELPPSCESTDAGPGGFFSPKPRVQRERTCRLRRRL